MTLALLSFSEAHQRVSRRTIVDKATLAAAADMIADIQTRGDDAIRSYAVRFGESGKAYTADAMRVAKERLPRSETDALSRIAARIAAFATAQRGAFGDIVTHAGGATLAHRLRPVMRAGCYVPAGRYPLPSSLLMTVLTAKAAGVADVIVCCPRPSDAVLAAAAIAGASAVVALGGVQAVAAMAYGLVGVPPCDVVVGPGNRWVSAAKQLLSGIVRIDLPAGPSELIVVADGTADPNLVAADLLSQAEHDEDALVAAIGLGDFDPEPVLRALNQQLASLPEPSQAIASSALARGFMTIAPTPVAAAALIDAFAPEHLSVQTLEPVTIMDLCHHYGAAFVGAGASEALGDYGIGPNHVLPTGGAARRYGALSPLNFLRVQTSIAAAAIDGHIVDDCIALATMEGLTAHARSLTIRREAVP